MWIEGVGKPPGCKLLRAGADIDRGIIRTLRIRGDFFASPEEGLEQVEQRLSGVPLVELAAAFDALIREAGVEVFGISGSGLASVLFSALVAMEESP
ncbi:MAG: hypothetical protein LBU17_00045 [Treponema sp.]|jgi:hypothetical protein|nr:hypothetical protein [Treponema sp.]